MKRKIYYIIILGSLVCSPIYAQGKKIITRAQDGAGGTIQVTKSLEGHTYSLTAVPNPGYEFHSWIDGNTNPTRQYVTTLDDTTDPIFRAVFVKHSDTHLTGGTVAITVSNPQTLQYNMTQTTGSCATFKGWSNGGTVNPKVYTEGDGTVVPIFSHGDNDLIARATNHPEGGIIRCDTLDCGFTLTAQPALGFNFLYWEDGSTNPVRDVDYIAANYSATFSDVLFLTINSNGLPSDFQDDALAKVTLQRPLSSTSFNTICLPFDMAVSEFGTNCEVYEMTSQSPSIVDGELTISFTQAVSNLEAGKPYLIKPQTDISSDLVLSQFKVLNSQLTPATSQYVDFVPVLEPTLLQADNNILFVGQGNLLYHPVAMGNIQGLRGYFRLHDIPSNVPTRLTFTKNVVTNSQDVLNTNLCPTKFIQNGQLLMRVHGAIYNSMGLTIK